MTDSPSSASSGSANFEKVQAGPDQSRSGRTDTARRLDETTGPHPSVTALKESFGDAVLHAEVNAGDQHVVFIDPARVVDILGWLKEDQGFDLLVDVTGVDYGGGRPIQVVYQLWSIPNKSALRVKAELPLTDLSIESVVPLWAAANWLEREVYDLFGVEFENHPDLRRILMPENYAEGHPLRKDFPLRGRFTRAEQTRRALQQNVEDYYIPAELGTGGRPQVVSAGADNREDADE